MKVTVSCGGKFHAFNLAEQLDKKGCLHKLITVFYSKNRGWLPEFRKDKEEINPDKVVTNIILALISGSLNKISLIKNLINWNYYFAEAFDIWTRSQVDKSDLLVAWSSFALHTLRAAKLDGTIIVIERGSSHILFQKEILEQEYERHGVNIKPIDGRIVQKELSEYNETDYIAVPSGYAKQTFIDQGINPEKIIHIPYGVDLSNFSPVPKEDHVFKIIFAGAISLQKGIPYLLEAFSQLRLKEAELILIGSISPEMEPFLRKHRDSFKYIRTVPYLELYKYLSQGSVFVLPSIQEGLALVILQALACGLPVICTTNTGGADIVRDKQEGFVIPIRDVEALKEKILYFYENEKERRRMSELALKRPQNFTWDIYGERIVAKYKEIVKNKKQ